MEQKSEQVQAIFLSILSNLMKKGYNFTFETQSFLVNHYILDSANVPSVLILKNSTVLLPSFCEMTNNINKNCSAQTIILKVYFFILDIFSKISHIIPGTNFYLEFLNANGG